VGLVSYGIGGLVVAHVGRRLLRLAVEAEDRQLEVFIELVRHVFARLRVAAHAMLGTVEGHQFKVLPMPQSQGQRIQVVRHTGGVVDQAHPFAPQHRRRRVGQKVIGTRANLGPDLGPETHTDQQT
jgi:hypothetical protein